VQPVPAAPLLVAIGALGVALLVAALAAGAGSGVVVAVGLIGVEHAAWLGTGGAVALAPFAGVGLLLAAELGFWSLDGRPPSRDEVRVGAGRAGRLALVAAGGGALAAAVLLAAQAPLPGARC
jgi:hypothetical protein